jgi:hypothetical protein
MEIAPSLPSQFHKLITKRNMFRLTKEIAMKKCLLLAILAAAFATPALPAETWYLGYNGKRCEIFADKRGGNWNMLSLHRSRHDAEKAKHNNDKCQKD